MQQSPGSCNAWKVRIDVNLRKAKVVCSTMPTLCYPYQICLSQGFQICSSYSPSSSASPNRVNRPPGDVCSVVMAERRADEICFHPPPVPVRRTNTFPEECIDPAACVEVYHLHCHFDVTSELAALELL